MPERARPSGLTGNLQITGFPAKADAGVLFCNFLQKVFLICNLLIAGEVLVV
jgi:hypothetical protein